MQQIASCKREPRGSKVRAPRAPASPGATSSLREREGEPSHRVERFVVDAGGTVRTSRRDKSRVTHVPTKCRLESCGRLSEPSGTRSHRNSFHSSTLSTCTHPRTTRIACASSSSTTATEPPPRPSSWKVVRSRTWSTCWTASTFLRPARTATAKLSGSLDGRASAGPLAHSGSTNPRRSTRDREVSSA